MGYLDALFGNVSSNGSPVELRGGLNFGSGLQVVENPSANRIDVSLIDLIDGTISLGGLELSAAVATRVLADSTWYTVAGTSAASALSGGNWTVGTSYPYLVWNGAGTATVLAFVSLSPTATSGHTIGFRFAVAGTGNTRTEQQMVAASVGPSIALIGGFEVGSGEAVTLELCNYSAAADVTVDEMSIVLVAFGGVDASA